MKCPHCLVEFHSTYSREYLGNDLDGKWVCATSNCPACNHFIIYLFNGENIYFPSNGEYYLKRSKRKLLVWPKGSSRPPCAKEVPPAIAEDYHEACLVLPDSPKASAALSRRCLQSILREAAGVTPNNLAREIQEVIDSEELPTRISDAIDAVRNIGNFAAHPNKSNKSGEIIAVEPGEAEWNLDVLESLFDFYFVQPATLRKKKSALDAKLADAGKMPMKDASAGKAAPKKKGILGKKKK